MARYTASTLSSEIAPIPAAAGPPLIIAPVIPHEEPLLITTVASQTKSSSSFADLFTYSGFILQLRLLVKRVLGLRTLFSDIERFEVNFLLSVQRYRRSKLPYIVRWMCDRMISTHPFYDASFAAWLQTIVAIYFVGFPLSWCLCANIFIIFIIAHYVRGQAPSDVEPRIKSRGRLSPSGFPCIELFIFGCVCAAVLYKFPGDLYALLGSIITPLTLFLLRVYGCTHFPSQLISSLVLGALTIPVYFNIGLYFYPKGLDNFSHILAILPPCLGYIGYVAYKVETNEMPFLRTPKATFERVLGEIARGDDATVAQDLNLNGRARRRRGGPSVDAAVAARMMAQEQAERQQQQQQQQTQFSSRKVSFAPGVAVPPSSDSEGQTTDYNSTARQFNSFRANVAPPSSTGAMPPRGPSSTAANNLARDSLSEMLGQMEPPSLGPPRAAFSSYRNDPDFLPSSSSSSAFASRGGEIFDEDLGRSRPKRDSFYYLMQSARKKREQNSDDIKSWSSLAPI